MVRRTGLVALFALVLALVCASAAGAYSRDGKLERAVEVIAGRPAEVRCPADMAEWGEMTGSLYAKPEDIMGVTHMLDDWVGLRPDLCPLARAAADESISRAGRALAVLTLVHEAYHVRQWSFRHFEATVECQAIRNFRTGARALGASPRQAEKLLIDAIYWHEQIARPGSAYYDQRCVVPVPARLITPQ